MSRRVNITCKYYWVKKYSDAGDEKAEIAFEQIASNMIEEYSKTKYARQG